MWSRARIGDTAVHPAYPVGESIPCAPRNKFDRLRRKRKALRAASPAGNRAVIRFGGRAFQGMMAGEQST